jgi:hypothetical protein
MSRVGVPPLDTSRFLDLDDRGWLDVSLCPA